MKTHLTITAVSLLSLALASASMASTTTTYSYDPVGQLVTKSRTGGGASGSAVTYSYDSAGNRTQLTAAPVATVYYNSSGYINSKSGGVWGSGTPANIVVTPIGGLGPYTYLWQRVSGDTLITSSGNTGSSINWTRSTGTGEYDAVWQCTVTDANSTATVGPLVMIQLNIAGGGIPP